MPDVYATIERAPEDVQHQLADVLELRAADAQQRAMLEAYLADLRPHGRASGDRLWHRRDLPPAFA